MPKSKQKSPVPRAFTKAFGVAHQLRSMSRLTLIRTPDERRVTRAFYDMIPPKFHERMWFWHPRIGEFHLKDKGNTLGSFYSHIRGTWHSSQAWEDSKDATTTLADFFKNDPRDSQNFLYVIDPELGWFNDPVVVRQLMDFANYSQEDDRWIAMIIIVVGSLDTELPERLKPFFNVVEDGEPLEAASIEARITDIFGKLRVNATSKDVEHFAEALSGRVATDFEVDNLLASTIISAKAAWKKLEDKDRGAFADYAVGEVFAKHLQAALEARSGSDAS